MSARRYFASRHGLEPGAEEGQNDICAHKNPETQFRPFLLISLCSLVQELSAKSLHSPQDPLEQELERIFGVKKSVFFVFLRKKGQRSGQTVKKIRNSDSTYHEIRVGRKIPGL